MEIILCWFVLGFAVACLFPEPKLWLAPLYLLCGPATWGVLGVAISQKLSLSDERFPWSMVVTGAIGSAFAFCAWALL